jgi:molybdenum cofactor biosynthesis protein B
MQKPQDQAVSASHRASGEGLRARCAVVTVSDSRTAATDVGGDLVARLLTEAGHEVGERILVRDDAGAVRTAIERAMRCGGEGADVVVTTGGTGIGPRDGTVEVVEGLLAKRLDGFGELFRALSFQQIGAAAMLSRAVAGLAGRTFVFALPGSPHAVELALSQLILPELGHLLRERDR